QGDGLVVARDQLQQGLLVVDRGVRPQLRIDRGGGGRGGGGGPAAHRGGGAGRNGGGHRHRGGGGDRDRGGRHGRVGGPGLLGATDGGTEAGEEHHAQRRRQLATSTRFPGHQGPDASAATRGRRRVGSGRH